MSKKVLLLGSILFLLILTLFPIKTEAQASAGQAYFVQSGDTLSKIASNFYGDSSLYPHIISGTNAKAQEDDSFRPISNANAIQVGQKLWIPTLTPTISTPTTPPAPTTSPTPTTLPAPTTVPTATAAPAPTTLPALPPQSSNIEYIDCAAFALSADASLTCAYVSVPQDHFDSSNSQTIQIAVVVVKASGSTPEPDPVVYLQGGPGQSTVDIAGPLTQYFLGLEHPSRDIVYIDQRGVGKSTPNLSCYWELEGFVLRAWNAPYTDESFADQYFASLRACIERLKAQGITLSAYTSAQNAADIIAVAKALGYEQQINLYGISYGARLALTILRDFGDTGYIRSAVIGGVYGPDANALEFAINLQERTELLFDACEKDAACQQAYPNLRARFYAFVAQLAQHPLTIDVTLPTGHTIKAQADEMAIYYYLLKQFVIGQTVIGDLPQQLDARVFILRIFESNFFIHKTRCS